MSSKCLTVSTKWSNSKKTMILVVCAAYSFLGNSALTGIAPYIGIYSFIFNITPTEASNLISYPNLAFGFGKSQWGYSTPPELAELTLPRISRASPDVSQVRPSACHVGIYDLRELH